MKNSEQSAFPFWANQTQTEAYLGLTKREYFAGQALIGICANPNIKADEERSARIARDIADKLLKQLEK